MTLTRAPLSEADRRFIIGKSGGCCNKCKMQVFIDNEFGERARIGDDAHIWAYSNNGPRGSDPSAPQNRNSRDNIILLCKNCHAEVDAQPIKFTCSSLTSMREDHYRWVTQCFGASHIQKPRFQHVIYLNIPRLDMYAVNNSIALPQLNFGDANCFYDLGMGAGRTMAAYVNVINHEEMYAYQIENDVDINGVSVGDFCFFPPMNFRTLSVCRVGEDVEASWERGKSIIYRKFGKWTLNCLIDPRWITTSTSGSLLRSGQLQIAGVVRVNKINFELHKVYTSPLFLAQTGGWLAF